MTVRLYERCAECHVGVPTSFPMPKKDLSWLHNGFFGLEQPDRNCNAHFEAHLWNGEVRFIDTLINNKTVASQISPELFDSICNYAVAFDQVEIIQPILQKLNQFTQILNKHLSSAFTLFAKSDCCYGLLKYILSNKELMAGISNFAKERAFVKAAGSHNNDVLRLFLDTPAFMQCLSEGSIRGAFFKAVQKCNTEGVKLLLDSTTCRSLITRTMLDTCIRWGHLYEHQDVVTILNNYKYTNIKRG